MKINHYSIMICDRYLTIMIYLNDDYSGGEKCFPLADNTTFSQKVSNIQSFWCVILQK